MSKTAILPVVSVICLAIAAITGYEISKEIQYAIAEVAAITVGAGLSIWGIYKSHKKKGEGKDGK